MAQFLIDDGLGSLGKRKGFLKKLMPSKAVQRVLAPPVFVPKEVIKQVPAVAKLPGVRPIPTTQKELKAVQKEDVKALRKVYVENVMKPLSKIDPTMKVHYEHELRDNEIKRLRAQIGGTEDPVKRQALEAQLKRLEKKEAAYQKTGAIVKTIVQIVMYLIPVTTAVAVAWQLANAAYAAAKAKQNMDQMREAKKARRASETAMFDMLVREGLTQDQARHVTQLLGQGVPLEDALKRGLAVGRLPEQEVKQWLVPTSKAEEYKPMKLESKEEAQQRFLSWLKGWRPEMYEAVVSKLQESQPLNGYVVDFDTGEFVYSDRGLAGLGFWESLATAVSSVVQAGSALLKASNDQKVVQLQLKQLKAQQAPLPTPVVERVAAGQMPAPAGSGAAAGAGGMPRWLLPAGLGLAAVGFGAWFFMRRGRR